MSPYYRDRDDRSLGVLGQQEGSPLERKGHPVKSPFAFGIDRERNSRMNLVPYLLIRTQCFPRILEENREVSRSFQVPAEKGNFKQGRFGGEPELDREAFQEDPVVEHAEVIGDKYIPAPGFNILDALCLYLHPGYEKDELRPESRTLMLESAGSVNEREEDADRRQDAGHCQNHGNAPDRIQTWKQFRRIHEPRILSRDFVSVELAASVPGFVPGEYFCYDSGNGILITGS